MAVDFRASHRAALIAAALLTLIAALALMRAHTFGEPIQRDLLIYAHVGQGLLDGGSLYDDWVDLKPPAPYWLFGAVGAMTGIGHLQMFVLGLAAGIATLVGLYLLFARALNAPLAGIAAAAMWVATGSDLRLEANEPNTEAFINAATVLWLWLLIGLPKRGGIGRALLCGGLIAIATLFKQVALVPAVLACLAHLYVRRETLGDAFRQTALVGAVVALAWIVIAASFAFDGRFGVFWQTLFVYPGEYGAASGQTVGASLIAGLSSERFFGSALGAFAWAVPALVLTSIVAMLRGRREFVYLIALLVGTYIAVAAPGWFFPHYFQLWLPALAVGFGMVLSVALDKASRARATIAIALATAALVVIVLVRTLPQYQLDARAWSEAKYGTLFTSAEDLGRALGPALGAGDNLFVYGVLPNLYLAAGARPSTSVVNIWFSFPEYGRSLSSRVGAEAIADLERDPPEIIVVDGFTDAHDDAAPIALRSWIDARYSVIATLPGYRLAVPNDAAPELIARVRAVPARYEALVAAAATR